MSHCCPKCGRLASEANRFCEACGAPLAALSPDSVYPDNYRARSRLSPDEVRGQVVQLKDHFEWAGSLLQETCIILENFACDVLPPGNARERLLGQAQELRDMQERFAMIEKESCARAAAIAEDMLTPMIYGTPEMMLGDPDPASGFRA